MLFSHSVSSASISSVWEACTCGMEIIIADRLP
jgi:hypothetical protein